MSFSEIIGQQEVKEFLVKTLNNGRIASGYLFCGPEGVGKTITALNFVRAMNCKNKVNDSCLSNSEEKCSSCKKIDIFSHPDIKVVFPVSKKMRDNHKRLSILQEGKMHLYAKTDVITIDDIRSIEKELLLKPFEAERRAIIVVDAETMRKTAQNAFLKILEEPPQNTSLILTSSHPERLLPTICSRCMRINFRRLSISKMKEFLSTVGTFTDEEVILVSRLSQGSIKKAMEFLSEEFIGERKMFKKIVLDNEYDILDETYDKNTLERFLKFLLLFSRDTYIGKLGGELINDDLKEQIKASSHNYTIEELRETVRILGNCLLGISGNINPQLISNIAYNRIRD